MRTSFIALFLGGLVGVLLFVPKTTFAHLGIVDANGGHVCESDCTEWGLVNNEYHHHEETGAAIRTLDNNDGIFDLELIERLGGSILLQVEQKGRAWYVDPTKGFRHDMPDGTSAYNIMSGLGLGISNSDLEQIPSVDSTQEMTDSDSVCSQNSLAARLSGYILLQTEEKGEAWYVYPGTCHRIYMPDGNAAFTVMRFLSLGISDKDLTRIPISLTPEGRFNYCGNGVQPFEDTESFQQYLCYTSQAGDTLESLALRYYAKMDAVEYLHVIDFEILEDLWQQHEGETITTIYQYDSDGNLISTNEREVTRADIIDGYLRTYTTELSPTVTLAPSTILLFDRTDRFALYLDVGYHDLFRRDEYVINPKTGLPITFSRDATGAYDVIEVQSDESAWPIVYDDGSFSYVKHLRMSEDLTNISYLADTKDWGEVCQEITSSGDLQSAHGYQFVINGRLNPHYSCGWSYELLAYNSSGTHYAIRNNKEQNTDSDQFIVLSDIGNGSFYDFSDSLLWFDDETLVYRAHNDDVWRVVVNHQDIAVFNYLEDLRLEDGKIIFHARHDDGHWSDEEIVL